MNDVPSQVIASIVIMFLLFASFLLVFLLNHQKKISYQKDMQILRESQQNQLIEAAIRSEESERHRIAEALHDEVGAILSSSKLHFQGIKFASLTHHDRQLYEKGEELLDDAIQKVRGISHNLHSNILKEFGLSEAIRHFVAKISTDAFLQVNTDLDNNYPTQNQENDMSIYRLVQELINNIIKHADAKNLYISSEYIDYRLKLVIFHNGNGLTQDQFEILRYQKDGLGLKNIQNRVILLKGSIEFLNSIEGYYINVDIPLNII